MSIMTAEQFFQIANNFALLGWILLAIAVYVNNTFFRDIVAGKIWPLTPDCAPNP